MPDIPPLTARVSECWQFLHCMCSAVAFEESVEAPITIPGIRTRWEMLVASRSRMDIWETEEWRRSWCSGNCRVLAFWEGKTIRWVHSLRAASNYGQSAHRSTNTMAKLTRGIMSAGSVDILCASSSL